MMQLLDNIAWHTLTGPHAQFAAGTDGARRYASGFSPIVGFADTQRPDFDALVKCCETGESFYSDGWSGEVPAGWRIDSETTMFKMVYDGAIPARDEAPDAIRLGPEHAVQALELATLTRPGPFGLRTIELGEYFVTSTKSSSWPWRANACAPERCMRSAVFARIRTFRAADSPAG
jgi:hypothetical protein